MIKIGFIDWFLDEWHANHYPGWIRESIQEKGKDGNPRFEVTDAWAVVDTPDGLSSEAWCHKFNVKRNESAESVAASCDAMIVLAPNHAEKHVELSQVPLRSGKPVYVDKTFAPNLAEAEAMFELAEANGTPLYSTSALRYAREFEAVRELGLEKERISLVSTRGPGAFINYGIHQVEMILTLMGTGFEKVMAHGPSKTPTLVFAFTGERIAVLQHLPDADFSFAVCGHSEQGDTITCEKKVEDDFWAPFTADMLRFFETRRPPVPKTETLEAMAMMEAGMKALAQAGSWVAR